MFHPAIKNAPRLIFLLSFVNNLHTLVQASHWINLNLWHDDLAVWDQQLSSSTMPNNNLTTITNPGGRQEVTGLPSCHELDELSDGQIKLCLLFSDHMRPVIQGAKLGLSECRFQFRHHHWNCSVLPLLPPSSELPWPPTTASTTTTTTTAQTRVLRENKNVNVNSRTKSNPSRRRNIRNQETTRVVGDVDGLYNPKDYMNLGSAVGGNGTEFSIGKDNKEMEPYPTTEYQLIPPSKQKKKGRKNHLVVFDESTNNIVLTTSSSTGTSPGGGKRDSQPQPQSILHLHHHLHNDKEEKANWNSILTRGTKEVAFAQSLWSAAVLEAVARSCREGSISSCGCGKTPRPSDLKDEWRWGGCGDNLNYGYKFAQNFVDIREQENIPVDKKAKARALVNLHNNEAGRRAVLKKTKIACKCHGVSGSCALVTCWHQIPTFREIGDYLKVRYEKATHVKLNKRGRLQVKKSGVPVPTVADLVFIEPSPNYCVQNETLGIYGTTGRMCNRTISSPNSCKNLCCNRGFTTNVVKSGHRCHCKFVWCCQVKCQECRSVQKYDVCK